MPASRPQKPHRHDMREKKPGISWHDHLVMLLHIGAEIEHGLMLQYLYSAYSIDTASCDGAEKASREAWRETILTVAREEMGHFITVQNVVRLLGAPMNLARRDFPWDVAYYPFPFCLEPFSKSSIAAYTFTESPPEAELEKEEDNRTGVRVRQQMQERYARYLNRDGTYRTGTKQEIDALVAERTSGKEPAHPVDEIYRQIIDLLEDDSRIDDSAFREESYAAQANWDDWGRRYRPAPKTLQADGSPPDKDTTDLRSVNATNVLIMPVGTRTEAVKALKAVSEQGEAPHLGAAKLQELSHFDRFLILYQDLCDGKGGDTPARAAATNPSTRADMAESTVITDPVTLKWATLANIRYRMLLAFLGHRLRSGAQHKVAVQDRETMLIHRVFAEMYNLKTLSTLLMEMPLSHDGGPGGPRAGPPFEVPYDLRMPFSEADTWRSHKDLVQAAIDLSEELLEESDRGQRYLRTQLGIDRQTIDWIDAILAGIGVPQREDRT